MYKKLNINSTVSVRLTEKGVEHYWKHMNTNVPDFMKESLRYFRDRADCFGLHEFTLWEFISIFGEQTKISSPLLFDVNILFREKDLEEVEVVAVVKE